MSKLIKTLFLCKNAIKKFKNIIAKKYSNSTCRLYLKGHVKNDILINIELFMSYYVGGFNGKKGKLLMLYL